MKRVRLLLGHTTIKILGLRSYLLPIFWVTTLMIFWKRTDSP